MGEELLGHGQLEGPDVVGLQVVTWNRAATKVRCTQEQRVNTLDLLGNPAVGPCLVHRVIKGG